GPSVCDKPGRTSAARRIRLKKSAKRMFRSRERKAAHLLIMKWGVTPARQRQLPSPIHLDSDMVAPWDRTSRPTASVTPILVRLAGHRAVNVDRRGQAAIDHQLHFDAAVLLAPFAGRVVGHRHRFAVAERQDDATQR